MNSQDLRIHETTVHRHFIDYILSAKIKPLNSASSGYLTAIQTMALIEQFTEYTYHHTHQIIGSVIEQFGIQYSVSGMNKWLLHYN